MAYLKDRVHIPAKNGIYSIDRRERLIYVSR